MSHAFIKAEAARQVNDKTRKLERAPGTSRAFAQNHNDLLAKRPQARSVQVRAIALISTNCSAKASPVTPISEPAGR
ncbi:hypothetical protein ACF0H2_10485 [Serratia marcescens]